MPGSTEILLIATYLASCGGILLAARALRAPITSPIAATVILLPVLFLLPAFVTKWTPLPVDHCARLAPWSSLPHPVARNANLNDPALQALPWAKAVRNSWLSGEFPWRNRWNGCGMSLAANGQSAAYAPWTILSMLVPLTKSLVLIAALKLFLTLSGTWLWLRQLGLSRDAALLGAVLNGFSFSMTFWLFWQQTAVLALLPWSLFWIERQLAGRERTSWWSLVVVFALFPLSGHVESEALGALWIGIWLGLRWVLGDRRIGASLGRLAGAALVALGLTAFSLIPQILAIRSSYRLEAARQPFWQPLLSWSPHLPRWPALFLTTLFPRSLGDQIASPLLSGAPASFPELGLGYIGCVGWCLVLMALVGARRFGDRRIAALVVSLLVLFAISSIAWPFAELAGVFPGLRYMFPVRFLSCVGIGASALAAFGIERLHDEFDRDRRRGLWLAAIACVLAVAALVVFGQLRQRHLQAGGLPSQIHSTLLTESTLLGLAVWTGICAFRRVKASAFVLGISVLACAELFFQGARYYRYGNPSLLYPPTPLIRFLNDRPRPFRVLGEGDALYPNSNAFARVEEVRTHDATERNDYVGFLDQTCGYDPRPYFKDIRDVNASALDFLNVRYLVANRDRDRPAAKWTLVYRGDDGSVFENALVLPRVFSPRRLRWLPDRSDPIAPVRDAGEFLRANGVDLRAKSDWRDLAYIQGRASVLEDNPEISVSDYRETTNRITFRAAAAGRRTAIAVLSIVQDGGWSAREETGHRLETFLVNGPFLGIRIPAGEHRIRLSYVEPGSLWGFSASVVTVLLLVVLQFVRQATGRDRRG